MKKVWILCFIFIFLFAAGSAEEAPIVISTGLYNADWEWTEDGTIEFNGDIDCIHVSEENPLIISLSVDVIPEGTETAAPVFRTVNGKKIPSRHPTSEITITFSEQTIQFSGAWIIPEGTVIDQAIIHLKIYNQKGELLAESNLWQNYNQIPEESPSTIRISFVESVIILAAIALIMIVVK